jgi:glucose/arabinose dehydrogenase
MNARAWFASTLVLPLACLACKSESAAAPGVSPVVGADAAPDAQGQAFVPPSGMCGTPGSRVFDANGGHDVPGGDPSAPSLAWLTLPAGFCAHHFANVPVSRVIRFAPNGDLFVTSPTNPTTGGGSNGLAAIMVVADDNHDLVGDTPTTFASNLPTTQGITFVPGFLYYQDGLIIRRVAYQSGQRTMTGTPEVVATLNYYPSTIHWSKSIDVADDGTIYVSNGGDQNERCGTILPRPFHGGLLKLDGDGGAVPVARGLRNPYAIKCQRGKGRCYSTELAKDFTADAGGREKLIPIRDGDDWGYPCCATQGLPYPDPDAGTVPDCSGVVPENVSFVIGNTPFGFDYEQGNFPSPWSKSIFVALHGANGTWVGAQIVAIGTDPATGEPLSGTNLDGGPSGAMRVFATGWDDGTLGHGRPADILFAPDGRMFVADDNAGEIFWVASYTR